MSGFEFKCRLAGEVKGIVRNKLQFLNVADDGSLHLVDVKIEGAQADDLKKFFGKIVLLEPVQVFQKDFQKFYKVQDISCIRILDKK